MDTDDFSTKRALKSLVDEEMNLNSTNLKLDPPSFKAYKFYSWWGPCYIGSMIMSMISGNWIYERITMDLTREPTEIYDRLIRQWSTIALVSSLMLTFAVGTFFTKLDNPDNIKVAGIDAAEFISIIFFLCVCVFTLSVTFSVLFTMALMTIPQTASTAFVSEFQGIISVPENLVICGSILFSAMMIIYGWLLFGQVFLFWSSLSLAVSVALFVVIKLYIMIKLDRIGGLWEKTAGD
jgi:hypothetical protein